MKRILVIGGGSIGERHVRCFLRTGRAEVSVCDTRDEIRQRLSDSYELRHAFSSFDAALAEEFDGAVVCTPADLHVPMATQLAERGVGVLIEKPLGASTDGVDELDALTRSRQVPVSVAYVMRQHPALQAMKRSLETGRFGRPVQVVYAGGQHFPFYRPGYREIYYTKHETGGGAIQDAMTHIMNAAEWIVGPVTKLVADADHCVLEGVEVEDTVHVVTRHDSVLGSFSLNQHQAVNESTLTIVCDRGSLRFEAHSTRWLSSVEPDTLWEVEEQFTLERDDMFVLQADAFISQLEESAPSACSLADALQTLRVNLASVVYVITGKWITL